jgi:CxxC motif-containing protein (DUF1111 family)
MLATVCALTLLSACGSSAPDTRELLEANSGGATTVHIANRKAFSQPAANLDVQRRAEFFMGNAFFNSPWVVAPASASARDGLGPLFNARSCDACHNNDGRGRPPERADERLVSLVIQFATPTPGANNAPGADPRYGVNLNPFAIGTIKAEGNVVIQHRDIHGKFADGTGYVLQAPEYQFTELAYGELAHDTSFSPRVAPSVIGVGLLEAVPESEILERADADDGNGDGISGRPNHVWNHLLNRVVIGRFGWKSNQPDVAHQTAAAFSAEIGMSSSLRPDQNCTAVEIECQQAPNGGSPEISDVIFQHIVNYQRTLGVPVRRDLDSDVTRRGAQLFVEADCAACHRPTFVTGDVKGAPWLSGQRIHPFSDLLLHDMGPQLADGRADFEATAAEWRTAPLWGIGLQKMVNGHTRLLHDGRARDINEAILWHGGEAQRAQQAYRNMTQADRDALLKFLESL